MAGPKRQKEDRDSVRTIGPKKNPPASERLQKSLLANKRVRNDKSLLGCPLGGNVVQVADSPPDEQ